MKNVLTVFAVLAIASVANAGLQISVNGVVSPPESEVTLNVGETAVIDIHATAWESGYLLLQGPGTIDASAPTLPLWENSSVANVQEPDLSELIVGLADFGYPDVLDIVTMDVVDTEDPYLTPNGLVIDGLKFTCTEVGDVVLTLLNANTFEEFDVVTIHQIPEPMTLGLLGLGGLFLRRRK